MKLNSILRYIIGIFFSLFFIAAHANLPAHHSHSFWRGFTSKFSLLKSPDRIAIRKEIQWWLNHRAYLNEMLRRSTFYLPYLYQKTKQKQLPAEFALLPAIESGFDPEAYSRAGAAGLWQMMPATATTMGLEMSWWYDGRRDTIHSTQAALHYLQFLHRNLHSWVLTAAAYNAGIGQVGAAEKRAHSSTFWHLRLPHETRRYVSRWLALAYLISHSSTFHIHLPEVNSKPTFSSILLRSQMNLAEISRLSQTPLLVIKKLNPGLRRWATPPEKSFQILLPSNNIKKFMHNLAKLVGQAHMSWRYHEVRATESLDKIVHEYHTNIALLRYVNHLPGSQNVLPGQGILVPLYLNKRFLLASTSKASDFAKQFKHDQDYIQAAINKVYRASII